mgnify:FL=1
MEKKWLVIGILLVLGIVSVWQIGHMVGLSVKTQGAEELFSFNSDTYSDNETFIFSDYDLKQDNDLGEVFALNGSNFIRTKKVNITEDDSFSVNILAKTEDSTNKNSLGLISSHSQNNETGFRLLYRNFDNKDRIYFEIGNVKDYVEIEKGSCLNKWCSYTLTYNTNNGKVKVYLNGEKVKEFKSNNKVSVNKNINIGKTIDINNEYFIGEISKAELYKGILSDGEIKVLSNKT